MSVVTVVPRQTDAWTVDDLDRIPDDGLQYELLDGVLLVTPAPIVVHQRIVVRLLRLLDDARPSELEVFVAPLDWRPDAQTSLQPDLLVVERDLVGERNITVPLHLAVEVLSPSTRRKDLVLKRSKYEDAGVQSYWVIDPEGPRITAWDLRDGRYVEVADTTGPVELERPFPVRIEPAGLR